MTRNSCEVPRKYLKGFMLLVRDSAEKKKKEDGLGVRLLESECLIV